MSKHRQSPIHASAPEDAAAIHCHVGIALPIGDQPPAEMMVFPAGTHTINATRNGKPIELTVHIDRRTAQAMQAALQAHRSRSQHRPYFDFNHAEDRASAWPLEFIWRDGPEAGVYASVEWSKEGADAVTGKIYRAFSPSFHLDNIAAVPARVTGAPLSMGGLVNDPAFKSISPLWARNGAQAANQTEDTHMTPEELAKLQARLKELEEQNAALKAKATSDETEAKIQAKEAEITELKQTVEKLDGEIKAKRHADADAAVKAAVARGVLPPKDEAIQAKWVKLIEDDPTNADLLNAKGANPALQTLTSPQGQAIHGQASITREDSNRVLLAYAQAATPRERGAIYARDISNRISAGEDFPTILQPELAVHAANSLGSLAGDLIAQRALELLTLTFPVLRSISTDFSDLSSGFNQTIQTRIISIPSVSAFSTSTGYAINDATTVDVPVTINQHKSCQIAFQNNELASTKRNMFEEQAQAMQYAIGKDVVDTLYALITAGNFTETATTQALATFARKHVIAIGTALSKRAVPQFMRKLLLNADYYAALAEDTTVVAIQNNPDAARAITTGKLPDLHGFGMIEAVNLPATGNLTGFGFFPSALAMAARVPDDYTKVLPGVTGGAVVRNIQDVNTGLTLMQVMFVDHILGKALCRYAIMYGVAKGDIKAGQRLISS